MPPTPFAPSHTTPFKSTLSTAMSGRRAAPAVAASASCWPPRAEALLGALDAAHWRFLAEGGANLLAAYAGPAPSPWLGPDGQRLALRLTKRSRALYGASGSRQAEEPIDAAAWQEQIIAPLLGEGIASALPATICLPLASPAARAFVEQLAARIEMHRPPARRRQDGIDTLAAQLWAVEDLSAPDAQGNDVLLMEIKPKWGFLPAPTHLGGSAAAHKSRTSRYRMHRVLKAQQAGVDVGHEQWAQTYDPLHLYADDEGSREQAVQALTREWRWGEWPAAEQGARGKKSNNLKLFLKGKEVDTAETQALEAWRDHMVPSSTTASIDLDSLDSLTGAMLSILRPALSSRSQLGLVLRRLGQLQRHLDALDVEGLAARWRTETGCAFGSCARDDGATSEAASALLTPPTLEEYAAVVRLFLAHEERLSASPDGDEAAEQAAVRQTQQLLADCPLRQATLAFLLSATFKDCSIMLRCLPASPQEAGNAAWRLEVRLIDLDPKPLAKLGHYEALDREIAECFAAWREAQQ